MPQVLNIDELTSDSEEVVKVIKIDGVEHKAVELTVQEYINRVKRSREIPEDATLDVKLEETIALLVSIFPTISVNRLRQMPLTHLNKIVAFALAGPEQEDTATKDTAPGN